jgi:hypothetical protein
MTALLNAWLRDTYWLIYVAGMLGGNIVLGVIVAQFLRSYSKREREKIEGPATAGAAGQ